MGENSNNNNNNSKIAGNTFVCLFVRSKQRKNALREQRLKLDFVTKLVNLLTFKPSLMLTALTSAPGNGCQYLLWLILNCERV